MRHKMTTEKIVPNEKFALSLGTTDKIKPSALYLEGKCIITPLSKKDNYVKDINILRRALKNATRDIFIKCDLFDNDFLFDIDIACRRMKFGKKTSVNFQIAFKQSKGDVLSFNEVYESIGEFITELTDSFEKSITANDFLIVD